MLGSRANIEFCVLLPTKQQQLGSNYEKFVSCRAILRWKQEAEGLAGKREKNFALIMKGRFMALVRGSRVKWSPATTFYTE